ncbi:MAG: helix-turn-helix transcriptional regulator [Clostridia bacterium]|nr:helix-turn-helix transcriptional regulator [Clostridia bacterium]
MTLGQKLAGYRKLSGMTQQQLGEHLNISAQAISKWEKDLSEPALATLRALAEFYKVTVDEILDLNSGFSDFGAGTPGVNEDKEETEQAESPKAPELTTIGFCKTCGIVVTEENLGAKSPAVICKDCQEKERLRQIAAEEEDTRRREEERRRKEAEIRFNRHKRKKRRTLAFILAGIIAAIFLAIMIYFMTTLFTPGILGFTLVGTYAVFAFIFAFCYEDYFIRDIVLDWAMRSLRCPMLIFTFDLDGFLWLAKMKILFWLIGIIFSIVVAIIGITLGLICAPFVFPYILYKEHQKILTGEAFKE